MSVETELPTAGCRCGVLAIKYITIRAITIPLILVALVTSCSSLEAETRVDPDNRSVKELELRDKQWISKTEKLGLEVLGFYAGTSDVTPNSLDVAFRKWKSDKTRDRAPDNVVATGLGVLFGNYIVKRKDCRWVVVTDKFGTELALRAPNGSEVYPINAVWKRIDPENEDVNFFEPIWTSVIENGMKDR